MSDSQQTQLKLKDCVELPDVLVNGLNSSHTYRLGQKLPGGWAKYGTDTGTALTAAESSNRGTPLKNGSAGVPSRSRRRNGSKKLPLRSTLPILSMLPRLGQSSGGRGSSGRRPQARNSSNDSINGDGQQKARVQLGTFGGVFTPSLLTILGLVLFLRLGYVTGSVGLGQMLAILALSTVVSVLTTASLAALATNLKVGGGGVYFLISRTLGPAFGGAIGLVLYVAMSISIAFYAIGLGEATASVLGSTNPSTPRLIAGITIFALLGLAWLGADIATRFQYVVMVCLTVAIIGYMVGVLDDLQPSLLLENFGSPDVPSPNDPAGLNITFWVAFAIFFPAITGFTQGVAMSGDLKTPSRSISVGTFGAIGISTVVYLVVVLTMAMTVTLAEMQEDTAIMRRLSVAPWLVDVGVIAATLSSAIASIMGAPRVLQRLAADRLIAPLEPFAVGSGADDNPRRGIALSALIALLAVVAGDLDMVAPVISMFFLASYGMINYATYLEARAASASFRPRFRHFDWRLSLAGTAACLGAIVAIGPVAGIVAGGALLWLYRYLERTVQQTRWADSTSGFAASGVRSNLQSLNANSATTRDWRPCTVAFAPRDPVRRTRLSTMAAWLEGGVGFTTVARIVAGRGAMVRKNAGRIGLELQQELADIDDEIGSVLYSRVIAADSLEAGVGAMVQAHGIGALKTNLVLTSWFEPDETDQNKVLDHLSMVRTVVRFGCNVGIVHAPDHGWERVPVSGNGTKAADNGSSDRPADPVIAVWWSDDHSGQLATMLAWMCTRGPVWRRAQIQVWVESDDPGERKRVSSVLAEARLPAQVVGMAKGHEFTARVRGAGMVFAPGEVKQDSVLGPGGEPIRAIINRLGLAVFLHAPAPFELDIQPDETDLAAVAQAHDRAVALSARAEELSREAATLLVSAELLRIDLTEGRPIDEEIVVQANTDASKAQRIYVDARTRADEAWRQVRELDPMASTEALRSEHWIGGEKRRDGTVSLG